MSAGIVMAEWLQGQGIGCNRSQPPPPSRLGAVLNPSLSSPSPDNLLALRSDSGISRPE